MIKRTLMAAAVVAVAGVLIGTPALAAHCPKDVKLINDAMSKTGTYWLGGDKKKMMIKDMSDKGLALHKAGKHKEAIKVLHEAMGTLGISH